MPGKRLVRKWAVEATLQRFQGQRSVTRVNGGRGTKRLLTLSAPSREELLVKRRFRARSREGVVLSSVAVVLEFGFLNSYLFERASRTV